MKTKSTYTQMIVLILLAVLTGIRPAVVHNNTVVLPLKTSANNDTEGTANNDDESNAQHPKIPPIFFPSSGVVNETRNTSENMEDDTTTATPAVNANATAQKTATTTATLSETTKPTTSTPSTAAVTSTIPMTTSGATKSATLTSTKAVTETPTSELTSTVIPTSTQTHSHHFTDSPTTENTLTTVKPKTITNVVLTSTETSPKPSAKSTVKTTSISANTSTLSVLISYATELPVTKSAASQIDNSSVTDLFNTTISNMNSSHDKLSSKADDLNSGDTFWPIAMGLTMGIPSLIVLGVTVAVLYNKRRHGAHRGLLSSMYEEN